MNDMDTIILTVVVICIIAFIAVYVIRPNFVRSRHSLIYIGAAALVVTMLIAAFGSPPDGPAGRPVVGIPMPPDGKIYRALLDTDLYDDQQVVRFYSGHECVFYGEASSTPEKTVLPFGVEGIPGKRWQFDIYAVRCLDGAKKVKMQALPVTARINIRPSDEFIIFDVE
ncbi:hypothetical protein GSG79_004270 [Escherichia coli]|nr:hypothetical protein [Escherichia coli]